MINHPLRSLYLPAERLLLLGMIIMIFLLAVPQIGRAETGASNQKKVYMVLVDKLSVNDINPASTPAITQLVREGAIGLASNRTLRSHGTIDSSLTIGAGNLARGYDNNLMAFNRDELIPKHNKTAAQLYLNLTGRDSADNQSLLVNLPEIITGMKLEKVNTVPGLLGENLRLNGLKVCVLGNGDTATEMLRSGVAVAMDASGKVALGDVGTDTCISSPASFLSLETNYSYLEKRLNEYRSQADVIVIDLSDLARLETADVPLAEIGIAQKQLQLGKIDSFIAGIKNKINPEEDLLLIISTSPSRDQTLKKDGFTTVIAYGKGYQRALLSSAATRREYVVANTDIAPTVLNFFGIKDAGQSMIGQPIQARAAGSRDTLQESLDLTNLSSTVNRLRVPLIKGYVVLQIIVILLGLLAVFNKRRLALLLEPLIILMVAGPLVLLFLGKFNLAYDWLYIVVALLASIIITAVTLFLCKGNGFRAFVSISFITVILLNIDLLTGTSLIQSSVLGYDPMSGARYYGIGNEYGGILVGSVIAVASAFYDRYRRSWVLGLIALVLLAQCYLIAAPSLGASSDGILTAPAAFLVTLVLLADIRIRPRHLLYMGAIILAAVLGLSYYDMHRPAEFQTHIGRAANLIANGGWQEGFTIVSRKLGMNLKLIRYTIWSWVLIVILMVLSLLVYRPVGAMHHIRKKHPYVVKGFAGIITGALVGLVINDSGIVEAATTSIYLVVPILLLMLHLDWDETHLSSSMFHGSMDEDR